MIELTGEQQQLLAKRYTENIEAYQAYLRGRYFWGKRSEEGLNKSIECFKQAVKIDPAYALAYAGMADAYTLLQRYGFATASKEETYRRARDAAVKALEIDESLAEAHTSLASIKFYQENDSLGAEKGYRRAIKLNPNYATATHWYSDLLAMTGREAEAVAEIKRAQRIDPLFPIINATLG